MSLTLLLIIGRCFIASMFLQSGISKIMSFASTEKMMAHFKFPVAKLSLLGAIAIEIVGGLGLLFGLFVPLVSALLIVFIILASVMIPGKLMFIVEKRAEAFRIIFTNIALIGGLLCLTAVTSKHLSSFR